MIRKLAIVSVAALVVTFFSACSKEQVQQKVEDMALSIMTEGDWIITQFSEGPTGITSSFKGWQCHFNRDKTCVAVNGTNRVAGTWDVSTPNQTITGLFPAGSNPLDKINGTWKIVRTNSSFGEFIQIKNGIEYKMELTKL